VRHRRIIAMACGLALLGTLIPVAAAGYISWKLAVSNERAKLATVAQRAITRADASLKQVAEALDTIAGLTEPPCSSEHIAAMRRLAMSTVVVDEFGYFQDGLLRCTSWGLITQSVKLDPPDYVAPNGLGVTLRMRPQANTGIEMMALQRGSYNALVPPLRFIDIVIDRKMQVVLQTESGGVVAAMNVPDIARASALLASPDAAHGGELFAVARNAGWIAVAMEPPSELEASLQQQFLLFLPLGAIIAGVMIALVVWLSRRRLSLVAELAAAIRGHDLKVEYQPIVSLTTGACVGAEALVRWERRDGSFVRPDLFIALAEDNGLIEQLTDEVIKRVVSDLRAFLLQRTHLHVAINIAAADIRAGRVLGIIRSTMVETGIRPEQIWLEVTERGFVEVEVARAMLSELRNAGHLVAMDDFGTGYSSLSLLQALPLDVIKIDKSFIDTIGKDASTSNVTSHIISMAKALRLKILAEGIERLEQATYLAESGVDYGQGWLYSRALPAEEFIAYAGAAKR
jgi:sensor c-di-GMP phosphodiesterase-like protein